MLGICLAMLETQEDKEKMERIFNLYRGLVFMIAKDYLKNDHDAEDAMQEAFLRIGKSLHNINNINSHKTKGYVVIVIENVCRNILKHNKKFEFVDIDDFANESLVAENDLEDMIEQKITIEQVKLAMEGLSERNQEILKLRYFYQLSNDEIAQTLKIDNANM